MIAVRETEMLLKSRLSLGELAEARNNSMCLKVSNIGLIGLLSSIRILQLNCIQA
jgi:hypothetical protein